MRRTNTLRRLRWAIAGALLFLVVCPSCDDDDDGYGSDVGMPCRDDIDCPSSVCCESRECGGGMCTYLCRGDRDCPPGTLCEDGMCFWACRDDRDCPPDQSCRHEHRVCQH